MTNEQLAVLLFHIMRQVNEGTSNMERELINRGCTLDEAINHAMDLRSLAGVMERQAAMLLGGEPLP